MSFTNNPKVTLALLRESYPLAFGLPTQPLKIGVRDELVAALGLDAADAKRLGKALQYYCGGGWYLSSIADGKQRLALDGTPCGAPTDDQVAAAKLALAERQVRTNAKRFAEALEADQQRDAERAAKRKPGLRAVVKRAPVVTIKPARLRTPLTLRKAATREPGRAELR